MMSGLEDDSLDLLIPFFLWIGIGVIIFLSLLLVFSERIRKKKLFKLANSAILSSMLGGTSEFKRRFKFFLILITIFLLIISLGKPFLGYDLREIRRLGIDILIAVDVSKSMSVKDVKPSRLERAKLSIIDFVNKLDGDRVGLILFGGRSFLSCPLTLDYNAFFFNLNAAKIGVINDRGTNISSAMYGALETFKKSKKKEKILVIITDGENLQGDALKTAKKVAKEGLRVFTVGVGTKAGELIPIEKHGRISFLKDEKNNYIKSRLDESTLSKISDLTNGKYYPLGNFGEGLSKVYENFLSKIKKEELVSKVKKTPKHKYQIFIFCAILFIILDLLISDKARSKKL